MSDYEAFVHELIGYIFKVQDKDDDNLSAEIICRKLYKYGLIENVNHEWRMKYRPKHRWPATVHNGRADKEDWQSYTIDRKAENSSEKPNNFDKDINVRSKDEPQTDCFLCKWLGEVDVCGRCRNRNLFCEAEPQPRCPKCGKRGYIRSLESMGVKLKVFDEYKWKCTNCNKYFKEEPKDEPQICDICRYYNSNIPCGSTPSACKEADKFAEEFVDGLKKLKPTISKMEQVDKDINVRSKNEPQTNKDFKVTYTCSFTECDNFKNFGFGEKCIECKRKQSEAKHKDEPQTDYKKWDAPPKVKLPTGEITTCVSVLAAAFEEASAFEDKLQMERSE